MATRRFASALENIARLSKKWRYWERERERERKGEKKRERQGKWRICTRGCMWIERGGRGQILATPLASPLWAAWWGGS